MSTRTLALCAMVSVVLGLSALASPGVAQARILLADDLNPYATQPAAEVMAATSVRQAPETTTTPAGTPSLMWMEARLLGLLNTARIEQGLASLKLDSRLVALARWRSGDMAARGYFGHVTPEGTMVFAEMDRQRIPYRLAGENLARNSSPADESPVVAHNGFMNSPSHARNVLEPTFTRAGIGVALSETGSFYLTELFAALD